METVLNESNSNLALYDTKTRWKKLLDHKTFTDPVFDSNGERVAHSEIAAEIGSWPRKRETAARACGVIRRSSQRAVNRLMFRQSRLMIDWRKRRHRTFSRAAAIFVLPIILLLVPVSRTCILVEYCPRRVYGSLEGISDDEILEVFGSECLGRRWNVDELDGTQELHSTWLLFYTGF